MNIASSVLAVAVVGSGISAFVPNGDDSVVRAFADSQRTATVAEASPSPAPVPSSSSDAVAPVVTVDTKDFAYAPADITVVVGTPVRFSNSDTVGHTVTAVDGSFDSQELSHGQTWTHVFSTAGTYPYYCAYHRYMKGVVRVK